MHNKLISIGLVGRPHGLRGHFLLGERDGSVLPSTIRWVTLGAADKGGQRYRVVSYKQVGHRYAMQLQGVNDRDAVETLKGLRLWVERQQMTVDESGEYFWQDLIGQTVRDAQGEALGEVVRVDNFNASDVLTISKNGQQLLLPVVDHYFNMTSIGPQGPLELRVGADTFSECWQS